MMLLNNKDLKLAFKDAREFCPIEEVGDILSRDNVMLTDMYHGNKGIMHLIRKTLPLMSEWTGEVADSTKETFRRYITLDNVTIN